MRVDVDGDQLVGLHGNLRSAFEPLRAHHDRIVLLCSNEHGTGFALVI
jgi:hypothetical protein